MVMEEGRSIEEGLLQLKNKNDDSECRITACVILSTFVAVCGSFSFGVAVSFLLYLTLIFSSSIEEQMKTTKLYEKKTYFIITLYLFSYSFCCFYTDWLHFRCWDRSYEGLGSFYRASMSLFYGFSSISKNMYWKLTK